MYIMASVIVDDFQTIAQSLLLLRKQAEQAGGLGGVERSMAFQQAEGALLIIDWHNQDIMGCIELPKVLGFVVDEDQLHFCSWADDAIYTLQGSELVHKISHPWLNHPHSLYKTKNGLLVSSSATDLVMEFDLKGNVLWQFRFTEAGYSLPYNRQFDPDQNYNGQYIPTHFHATHVNAALPLDDAHFLATLFTTGELVKVNHQTGNVEVLLDGLIHPHAIRSRDGGFVLSDTEGRAAVLLDESLCVTKRFPLEASWIQDAMCLPDNMMYIDNFPLPNALRPVSSVVGKTKVVEVSKGGAQQTLAFGNQYRLFELQTISQAQAEHWSTAWGNVAGDISDYYWY